MQINLLKETLTVLAEHKKSPDDVRWVQWAVKLGDEFYCSFAEFVNAADCNYNNGFGGNEVIISLEIVGSDWWLERGEYDGSEWWEFKTLPTQPLRHRTPVMEDIVCK